MSKSNLFHLGFQPWRCQSSQFCFYFLKCRHVIVTTKSSSSNSTYRFLVKLPDLRNAMRGAAFLQLPSRSRAIGHSYVLEV